MNDYTAIVARFAQDGARIIHLDPKKHYSHIGRMATRPLEPGFIPVDAPAKVVTVSYYPNATELTSGTYEQSRRSFIQWAATGSADDYTLAYEDWRRFLPEIPFYRDFNVPIFTRVGIADSEFAWLPLVKCPLPAKTKVPDDDVLTDRILLWEQLALLRPRVILAQGFDAYNVVSGMCEDKGFPDHIVLQRIGRVGTNAYHAEEDARVCRELEAALG